MFHNPQFFKLNLKRNPVFIFVSKLIQSTFIYKILKKNKKQI